MLWARMVAYVTGTVNQELLLRNEYLGAENRILRGQTMEEWGFLRGCRYLLHDRDTKFCASFCELLESGSIKTICLPARSPNLNSFAERWVRSVRKAAVRCRERLGGLLKYYEREAA